MRRLLATALLLVGTVACDDTVFPSHGGGEVEGEGFCAVLGVLDGCTACHSPSGGVQGGLDLDTDPHAALVDAESSQFPGVILVVPGDPEGSLLYRKLTGAQSAEEGSAMPPGSAVSDASIEAVRDWIAEGASSECDRTDTGGGGYHPDGFADPEVHGLEAKLHEQTCTACHGSTLEGGAGPSCDTCHTTGWRTDCTFCHGGEEDETGAPPRDIDGSTTGISFPPHNRHVTENTHAAYDCSTCHARPTDVLTAGHLFDDTPARAENVFSGLAAGTSYDGTTCTTYCHGDGQRSGSESEAATDLGCDGCHPSASSGRDAWNEMSGEHEDHLENAVPCAGCHAETAASNTAIAEPAKHVNGQVDVVFDPASTIVMTGSTRKTCNGTCHGVSHDDRDWQ